MEITTEQLDKYLDRLVRMEGLYWVDDEILPGPMYPHIISAICDVKCLMNYLEDDECECEQLAEFAAEVDEVLGLMVWRRRLS